MAMPQAALAEEVAIKTRAETVEIFARELQHQGSQQSATYPSHAGQLRLNGSGGRTEKRIKTIISRLTTIAHMYDHLLGVGLDGTIDFADYLRILCIRLPDFKVGCISRSISFATQHPRSSILIQ